MIDSRLLRVLLGLALALTSLGSMAQVSGTKNIPGDYANLATAITDVNTVGVGAGGVTLNLLAGNPQTTPAGGYAITATGTLANPITVACNGNTITAPTPQTSGLLNDAIFKLIGADFVTINGCVMNENAANTTTAAGTNNMTEWGIALLYASTTDGAQNATLQGNTITLNRTYQNTFGIYSNSTHSATAVSTSATATTAAGGNSGLRIYGNTISNVNVGIVVVGPTAAVDHNEVVDIGGVALATGNTITNYGTTGTFSSYANVSGTVNGILVRNTRNYNVSFNTVTSSVGGVTLGTLNGILIVSFSNAPTGTLVNSINNNSISLKSGLIGGAMNGISVQATTVSTTTTLSINNNNFSDSGHTVAGTAAITFLINAATTLNTNINNNTFTNLSVNTTGNVTLISNSVTHPAGAVTNVNNNAIVGTFAKTGAGGTVRLYDAFGSTTTGSETNTGNNFSNITLTGATTFGGWRCADGATPFPSKTVTNNTFGNIVGGTSAMTVLDVSFSPSSTITGNLVSSISGGAGTAAVVGITSSSGTQLFESNTVHTITASTTSNVTGISLTGGTAQTLSRNRVYNIENTNAAPTSASGILVSSGTTINLHNNLVGDIRAPNASAANAAIGINITGGTAVNAAYNSVRLQASSVGANFGSSALSASSTPTVALNNNVLVNLSTAAGTGLTVAYRRSSTTLTSYANSSNNNDFFAGTPSATNLIFSDGTNFDQTLAAYKARVATRDSAAVTENPPFLSTAGANANFLHIDPAVATQLESGGAPFAGVSVDFDGDTRNASTPDIGADEFTGTVLDLNGPTITYALLGNTTQTSNRTVNATITDPSGVASGATAPRVYFRKNAGSYFSTGCTGVGPAYTCTIDNALIGGVVAPDVVNYFVIAQDTIGNVSANPGAGLVAANVNTITTPPTTPNSYSIVTPFSGIKTVCAAGCDYPTLTGAGGAFSAINSAVVAGNVEIQVAGDLIVGEDGSNGLNALNEQPAASNFTVRIYPTGAARAITGAFNGALIRMNGSSRVTIDGSLGGVGTDRSLTISNTSVTTPSVILFGSIGTTPITDNTLKNCVVINGVTTSSAVVISDATAIGAAGFFSNITIQNNDVQKAFIGVFATGGTTPQNGSNLTYTQNTLNTSGANAIRIVGLYMQGVNGATVSQNTLGNFSNVEGENDTGIWLATGTSNATVSNNTVTNLGMTLTTGFAPFGIRESSGLAASGNNISSNSVSNLSTTGSTGLRGIAASSGGVTIQGNNIQGIANNNTGTFGAFGIDLTAGNDAVIKNNFVSDINHNMTGGAAFSPDFGVVGIRLGAGTGHKVYHNSVNLFGAHTGTATTSLLSAALSISTTTQTGIDVRNNILANNLTGGTTSIAHVSVFLPSGGTSAMNLTWNNNSYYFGTDAARQGVAQVGVTAGTTFFTTLPALAAYTSTLSAGATNDNASVAASTAVPFTSSGDLHLPGPLAVQGVPIATVPVDFDGDTRSLTAPDLGADELPRYSVGGTVTGLAGTGLVLRNNAGDDLAISANGAFTFANRLLTGSTYAVTVFTQPGSPTQLCTVSNGGGTVASANVTNVAVTCTTSTYTVGGNVTGLSGSGLILQNNGGDNLPISANGVFTFATPVNDSGPYAVSVFAQPGSPTQTCVVANGSGTVAGANITNVAVSCTTNTYTVGGNVTGLTGSGLVLRNNGGDDLPISGNGAFTFATPVASGGSYVVSVFAQPGTPTQTCVVSNGSGNVSNANVTNVAVSCTTNTYTVGGSVTGLTGSGLVLRNNGGDDLPISGNGAFAFATPVASGGTYAVTVFAQPGSPTQTCVVTNGGGTVGSANVTDVAVSCTTNTYTVGGSVTGLTGSGLVLRNNGGDDLPIAGDGAFTFATPVASGASYVVTVFTQPGSPAQICTVGNGSGTIGNANVSNVAITCATNTFTVGGSVSGLSGSGLVLRNNGGDDLPIAGNGAFTFATPIASGGAYAVTVFAQPGSPTQTCTVTNGSGTVGGANVTDVAVSCTTNTYTVGGSVSGLTGSGLVLRNNGGDNLPISGNGAFTFATPVASGASYAVTVFTQPGSPAQTCSVTNGSGTIGAANVSNVAVACATNNTAPTIAAVGVTRRAGDAGATATIANVTDAEDALNTLAVSVNGAATATVNGVTVNSISTSVAGVVSANVVAACGATAAGFTLRVTDSGALFNEATLNVTVDPNLAPTLTYAAANAVFGQSLNLNPATGPSDSGSVAGVAVQSPGTYTGGVTVNAAGVVSLTSAAPVGVHTIVIRATDNCAATTDANLALTVGQAATTTAITSDTPDPSFAGQSVTVSYTVTANAPGSGTPAGSVTVGDGVDSCTATVAAGQCSLALSTPGARTLTATYAGNASFAGSAGTAAHTVSPTANLSITKTVNDALIGTGVIQYTITVANAGPSPANGITVVDTFPAVVTGVNWTCAGTGGGACSGSGSGNINQLANLPVGGTVVYSITGSVALPLPNSISNTATVAAPAGTTDPSAANNTSTAVTVFIFFRNGFEDGGVAAPVAEKLQFAAKGGYASLQLPISDIASLPVDQESVEVIRFAVADSLIVVQTRRLGDVIQVRSLQVNADRSWNAGSWTSLDADRLYFEWSAGAAGQQGAVPLTRLRMQQ